MVTTSFKWTTCRRPSSNLRPGRASWDTGSSHKTFGGGLVQSELGAAAALFTTLKVPWGSKTWPQPPIGPESRHDDKVSGTLGNNRGNTERYQHDRREGHADTRGRFSPQPRRATVPVHHSHPEPAWRARIQGLVRAIGEGDEATVEAAVLQLSSRRRIFAPLGMVVGAFVMLFAGLKLLFSNWRLTLVQVLPAMWIWGAMMDLKPHVFHGKSFHRLDGWELVAAIMAVGHHRRQLLLERRVRLCHCQIRPARDRTRVHPGPVACRPVLGWGGDRIAIWHRRFLRRPLGSRWFTVSMSIVIAIMMVTYVSMPSRLIGLKTSYSKADKLKATVVGGAIGA